ncbi:MAG: hypothetical protein J4F28_00025 [Nitrosopumilaceae archaeon]|nr:hypothetical protein [Nitrosopumilaceae archaeon]
MPLLLSEAKDSSDTTAPAAAAKPAAAKPAPAKKAEDKKEEKSPEDKAASARAAMEKADAAIKAAEQAELDAKQAAEKAAAAKKAAEEAAEAEYKAIAEQVKADVAKKPVHTFKRQSEEIFRRDMGEPEFFLDRKDRFPRPILTPQQQESLTRHAETPQDQTPEYVPEHVLSPEFEGVSNYERGVESYLEELRSKLRKLKQVKDADSVAVEVARVKANITYLESLHENFYLGMNVFRTARGGRSKVA